MQNQANSSRGPQPDRSGSIWLVQAFSGVLLIPLLVLHMIAHHFIVEGGLREFQQVIDYISHPAIFATTIIFLIVVSLHAMLGLRAIFVDLRPSPAARSAVDRILLVITIAIIAYGIWLELTIARM